MVRNYKRKTEDRWSKEDLLEALTNIKEAKIKINDAARQYRISRATLYRQFKKFLQAGGKCDVNQFRTCGGNPILTKVEEDVLEKTIRDLREQGFTVTSSDIKRICFEYCDSNGIPNQFNQEKRMASDDWYYGFLKRHPDVRIGDGSLPAEIAPKPKKKKKKGDDDDQQHQILGLIGVKSEPKSPARGNNSALVVASGSGVNFGKGGSPKKLTQATLSKKSSPKRKAPSPKQRAKKAKLHSGTTIIIKQEEGVLEQLEDERDEEEMEEDDEILLHQETDGSSSKAEGEDEEDDEEQEDEEEEEDGEEQGEEDEEQDQEEDEEENEEEDGEGEIVDEEQEDVEEDQEQEQGDEDDDDQEEEEDEEEEEEEEDDE